MGQHRRIRGDELTSMLMVSLSVRHGRELERTNATLDALALALTAGAPSTRRVHKRKRPTGHEEPESAKRKNTV